MASRAERPKRTLRPVLSRAPPEERASDEDDVLASLAKGRKRQAHDREAIVKVFAEPAGLHLRLQILVGGGDHAGVHPSGLATADPLDHTLLEKAQELHLEERAHLTDLVEEERAALGQLSSLPFRWMCAPV